MIDVNHPHVTSKRTGTRRIFDLSVQIPDISEKMR